MNTYQSPFRDWAYRAGLIAILISLAVFCLGIWTSSPDGLFLINHAISVTFFISYWVSGRFNKQKKGTIHHVFLTLILFLISAYSLNASMNVFEDSTDWFCVLLIITCANYITLAFEDRTPRWLRPLQFFILGVSLSMFLYLAIYLLPLYLISIPGLLAVGISIHTFVPAFFLIITARYLIRQSKKQWTMTVVGAASCLTVVVVYSVLWTSNNNRLNKHYYTSFMQDDSYPSWINTAMYSKNDGLTNKILKGGIIYITANLHNMNLFGMRPSRAFEEKRKHDPLIMIASLFGHTTIPEDERVKILKLNLDARHRTQERLWNGDNLATKNVSTNIKVWPKQHIAYTEKTVTVGNDASPESRFWNQQEAIYTFHLPEGSVISSLSLWVRSVEQKSVLTTKGKADTAYKQIVGVERRDPSVVHWQEGNTVSVRVFPVLPGESRTFRLGITTPLPVENGRLVYRSINFEGPSNFSTKEQGAVSFEQPVADLSGNVSLEAHSSSRYSFEGSYNPAMELSWKNETVQPASFSFNNNTYSIQPYVQQRSASDIQKVYLDVNSSWTSDDFEKVFAMVKDKKVMVYDNNMEVVTPENKNDIFRSMQSKRFSLFPVYAIHDKAHSMLITKGDNISATLDDLNESNFFKHLKEMQHDERIKLFALNNQLSYYLKSLREMRFFNYESGSVDDLQKLIREKSFAADIENDNQIVLHDAAITITKSSGSSLSNAPDHLMRLFAYNDIMRKGNCDFLNASTPVDSALIAEASAAHIVTPVSSMLVLETAQDYKDFNIEASKNSLANASMKSNGSVPEPHEWALIILSLSTVLYLSWKQKRKLWTT